MKKNIGIIGAGFVAQTLALGFGAAGYPVRISTRNVAKTLADTTPNGYGAPGPGVFHTAHPEIPFVTFAEAAAWGEILINAASGSGSLDALGSAGTANLGSKILIDLANPLAFNPGMPPMLSVSNTDSLGEQIQRAFPQLRVVKTLNTLNCAYMLSPGAIGQGDTTLFMSGNDASAKKGVHELLVAFGWKDVIDLGDITTARGTEELLPLWVRLMGAWGHPNFQFKIVR